MLKLKNLVNWRKLPQIPNDHKRKDTIVIEYDREYCNADIETDKDYQKLIFPDYVNVEKYIGFDLYGRMIWSPHDDPADYPYRFFIYILNVKDLEKETGMKGCDIAKVIKKNLIKYARPNTYGDRTYRAPAFWARLAVTGVATVVIGLLTKYYLF
jgi:hypothetical protein